MVRRLKREAMRCFECEGNWPNRIAERMDLLKEGGGGKGKVEGIP